MAADQIGRLMIAVMATGECVFDWKFELQLEMNKHGKSKGKDTKMERAESEN